ncbi:Pkr1 domain containing protein [Pyrenophora teres f. maculata]|nr:Pkr1 domain containing protein [Pyrenophora teres f. maculata]
MAAFFEQLWESIFTAGPTPTLLVATNASFAALQVLLLVMLVVTYSIHFVILSLLCGGLWWSINWFAAEIKAAQAKEEEAKRIREARRSGKDRGDGGDGEAMDTGDDTEVEPEAEQKQTLKPKTQSSRAPRPETQSTVFVDRPSASGNTQKTSQVQAQASVSTGSGGPTAVSTTGTTTSLAAPVDEALKRRKGMGESTGDISTDSEWDKLSEDSEGR